MKTRKLWHRHTGRGGKLKTQGEENDHLKAKEKGHRTDTCSPPVFDLAAQETVRKSISVTYTYRNKLTHKCLRSLWRWILLTPVQKLTPGSSRKPFSYFFQAYFESNVILNLKLWKELELYLSVEKNTQIQRNYSDLRIPPSNTI